MSETVSELQQIFEVLQTQVESLSKPEITTPLEALEQSAKEVEKAWGHSWLGYQSHVYYEGLEPPPPGANFSSEWGFTQLYTMGTTGDWVQFSAALLRKQFARGPAILIPGMLKKLSRRAGSSSKRNETTSSQS